MNKHELTALQRVYYCVSNKTNTLTREVKFMQEVKIVPTGEEIKSRSGIFPAGRLLRRFGFDALSRLDDSPTKKPEYPSPDLFMSYVAMLCLGYRDFYDIEKFRDDRMFKVALGIREVPSEVTLRDRIGLNVGACGDLRAMNAGTVWDAMKPTPAVLSNGRRVVFADLDVSVHDNSGSRYREGVGMTYKGVSGFAPAYVYVGQEGYMLDAELRPGEQHCQNGTPELMRGVMSGAERRNIRLLFRMDSGNDALENILLCHGRHHHYIIAVNPRGKDISELMEDAEFFGERVEAVPGTESYIYKETVFHKGKRGGLIQAYRVARLDRTLVDENGQKLLIPKDELSMWWTDLALPAREVIGLYNDHGTSEQYHSEMKTDLDMEKFPALSFDVNKVVHAAAMIAFNVLRKMGVDAAALSKCKNRPLRLRIRTVIMEVMRSAGKFVFSGNRYILRMFDADTALPTVRHLYQAYG